MCGAPHKVHRTVTDALNGPSDAMDVGRQAGVDIGLAHGDTNRTAPLKRIAAEAHANTSPTTRPRWTRTTRPRGWLGGLLCPRGEASAGAVAVRASVVLVGRRDYQSYDVNVIQRQLGHANLGTTSIYLQGIDIEEIISTVHARRAPMVSATAGLQL
jgi:integrase